jgi:hypothetical protein
MLHTSADWTIAAAMTNASATGSPSASARRSRTAPRRRRAIARAVPCVARAHVPTDDRHPGGRQPTDCRGASGGGGRSGAQSAFPLPTSLPGAPGATVLPSRARVQPRAVGQSAVVNSRESVSWRVGSASTKTWSPAARRVGSSSESGWPSRTMRLTQSARPARRCPGDDAARYRSRDQTMSHDPTTQTSTNTPQRAYHARDSSADKRTRMIRKVGRSPCTHRDSRPPLPRHRAARGRKLRRHARVGGEAGIQPSRARSPREGPPTSRFTRQTGTPRFSDKLDSSQAPIKPCKGAGSEQDLSRGEPR